jgi:SAM-dependent MidA family methyltransferase
MSPAHHLLVEEIKKQGAIPFRRFMEVALYCPEAGYYEQICHTPGRKGDFFTSVSVGPVFGELLARQFCRWMDGLPAQRVSLIEGGAQDGQLARDILTWTARCRPDCLERLEYLILEPSARRRSWQAETLGDLAELARWVAAWQEVGESRVTGIVFANELLDAMPVVRLGWDATVQGWNEWGVQWDGQRFRWARLDKVSQLPGCAARWLVELTKKVADRLPDGCIVEIAPSAVEWWQQAALALQMGWLLALDYGWDSAEGWRLFEAAGTLRAYREHRIEEDVLQSPGQQDITAHVNWGLVQKAGEEAGLATVALLQQGRWLSRIVSDAAAGGRADPKWAPTEIRQFHTLTHPAQLGARFQVLVQAKGLAH